MSQYCEDFNIAVNSARIAAGLDPLPDLDRNLMVSGSSYLMGETRAETFIELDKLINTNKSAKTIEWKCPACGIINNIEATYCGEKTQWVAEDQEKRQGRKCMDDFFAQYPTPIDTSQVNWDILGLKEVKISTGEMVMKHFEISKQLTTSEIIKKAKETGIIKGDVSIDYLGRIDFVMDLKEKTIRDSIEEIRTLVVNEFFCDIKNMSGNIVQFVEVPLCLLNLAPGDTRISFSLMTKRALGVWNE